MSSSRAPANVALLLGAVALLAISVAAIVSWQTTATLLRSLYIAVPVAIAAGLVAVVVARRARLRLDRSIRRAGEGLVRTSRWLAWTGLYIAVTGGLALVFYGVLRARS
jgi:hypothetical protein